MTGMNEKPKTTLPRGDLLLIAFIILDVVLGVCFFYR
jgi:hypothetical protein